jgi:hypothetical protein
MMCDLVNKSVEGISAQARRIEKVDAGYLRFQTKDIRHPLPLISNGSAYLPD